MISERSAGRGLLGCSPSTALRILLFVAFATSKMASALARNPLGGSFAPKVSLSGGPCGAYLYTDNIFYVKLYMITINL